MKKLFLNYQKEEEQDQGEVENITHYHNIKNHFQNKDNVNNKS